MIRVSIDDKEVVAGIEQLKDDLPFATALALTKAAQEGQKAARKLVGGVFRQRNDWTVRNQKITPATKQSQVAEVYTDTANRRTGAPDYLGLQQDGGEKVAHNGKGYLAIPTAALRQMAGGPDKPIPDWLRPGALLKYFQNGGRYLTRRGKERMQPKLIRGYAFWLAPLKTGGEVILTRYHGAPRDHATVVYVMVKRAHVRKRFPLEEQVRELLERDFDNIWDRAAAEVLVNKALGHGLKVTF